MKKYILNVDYFENKLYMRSKYDTSPRSYGNIEIDEKDRDNFNSLWKGIITFEQAHC